jgi:hypothetical protein
VNPYVSLVLFQMRDGDNIFSGFNDESFGKCSDYFARFALEQLVLKTTNVPIVH